jgi:hypothetical protein
MEAMRKGWTDDRLDDLSKRMDQRFDRVDRDIGELRQESHALQRTTIQVGGGLLAANVGSMAAVIGLMITRL